MSFGRQVGNNKLRLKIVGMHECLSAGCECEREIAISRVKPETIYWLKMSKISDLDNFAIDTGKTSTCTYTLCI